MKSLERAAMFEAISLVVEEIDSIFKEYGFDPANFDPDNDEFVDNPDVEFFNTMYNHVHCIKKLIE